MQTINTGRLGPSHAATERMLLRSIGLHYPTAAPEGVRHIRHDYEVSMFIIRFRARHALA